MKTFNIIKAAAFLLVFAPNCAVSQVSNEERLLAERLALLTIDKKCGFFNNNERRALNAFMLQVRGFLLRGGATDARVGLIMSQAKNAAALKPCNDSVVQNEVARAKKAYLGWKGQYIAEYKGTYRSWTASRAGVDNWRAWQELGNGVRAGFVLAPYGLAFAVETPSLDVATMRVYYRNSMLLGLPKSNTNLKPPPRAGTFSENASSILDAQTKLRVDAKPNKGIMAVFSNDVTRALVSLDPRDCFEVEIVNKKGGISFYVVEVGDIITAFALGAEF